MTPRRILWIACAVLISLVLLSACAPPPTPSGETAESAPAAVESPAAPAPPDSAAAPEEPLPPEIAAPPLLTPGQRIIVFARQQMGVRYRAFGSSPDEGFDCSGLTWYAHRLAGVEIPRSSLMQWHRARRVPLEQLRVGDLIFFRIRGQEVSHVGLYLGDRQFIHAPSKGRRVSVSRLDSPYWKKRLVSAGRYVEEDGSIARRN